PRQARRWSCVGGSVMRELFSKRCSDLPASSNRYRHELGSMVDVSIRADLSSELDRLDEDSATSCCT
ncbi:MAG: hypothetical protein AB7K09_18155, partial [Planctomycetota bacterium]